MTHAAPFLILRADADSRIGTGHVMRCLALALAWRAEGGRVRLLGRVQSPALERRLADAGVELTQLAAAHPDPADAAALAGAVAQARAGGGERPWAALDGYHFDAGYHAVAQAAGARVLVVDDEARLAACAADVILNQNIYAPDLRYAAPGARLLLGTGYALLRPEFAVAREQRRPESGPGLRVLATMGGADPAGATLTAVRALRLAKVPGLSARIVAGPANPRLADIAAACAGDPRLELLPSVEDMAGLMLWADLALTAAGSTCWEGCCLGLPLLMASIADNQEGIARGLDARGAGLSLGPAQALDPAVLARKLEELAADAPRRAAMASVGRSLVDGQGARRVADFLLGRGLALRPVRPDDAGRLFAWRNDPAVRAASFSTQPLDWDAHVAWLAGRLADPACRMYLAEDRDGPAGQARFELEAGGLAVASVSLDARLRGRGLGAALIAAAAQRYQAEFPQRGLRAFVRLDNPASARAFARAGFAPAGQAEVRGCPSLVLEHPAGTAPGAGEVRP